MQNIHVVKVKTLKSKQHYEVKTHNMKKRTVPMNVNDMKYFSSNVLNLSLSQSSAHWSQNKGH